MTEESELVSAELWEAGTVGVRELDNDVRALLIAGFETNSKREELLARFARFSPEWRSEPDRNWVEETQAAWPPRVVGRRLFLAPFWSETPTPPERVRVIHNPGLACGTGEHPCTQLALLALERCVFQGCAVLDIGTGSGLLAVAALRLGAAKSVGVDPDEAALQGARENFQLNGCTPQLIAGSADCLASGSSDITVANISATVLLALFEDVLRITRPEGWIILTGFPKAEASVFEGAFANSETLALGEWRCLVAECSSIVT